MAQGITIDFSGLGQAIVNALLSGVQALVSGLPRAFEVWLFGALQGLISSEGNTNLMTQNPLDWITRDVDVNLLYTDGTAAEAAIAVLVLAIQAFRIMNGRVEMWEAVMRTGFCVLMGNGVLFWAERILGIVNAFAAGVAADPVNIIDQPLPSGIEVGFLLIIAALFAALTWIKGAVGVVFLKVLIVSAPYLLTLSALPILEGLGRWWGEEFTTWTLRPFMVALALRLGLGLAARQGGDIGLIFALVSFWLAWTMDTRIRRFSMGAWGGMSQVGLFARAARLAAGAFSGGAAGAAAGAATGVAAGAGAGAGAGAAAGALPTP